MPSAGPDLIEVRTDEAFDIDRLATWLAPRLAGTDGRPQVSQFSGGHANLTYLLDYGARQLVLRRPPLGHVLATAHDMGREHTIITALGPTDIPVPRTRGLCTDEAAYVNGASLAVDGGLVVGRVKA